MKLKLMTSVFLVIFGLVTATGLVMANHNGAVIEEPIIAACGETTISAHIANPAGTHKVGNMRLVVSADGETNNVLIPTDGNSASLTVGPFFTDTTISYRVFGGGERNYDLPLWNGFGDTTFTADVNNYGSANGWDWVVAGPDDNNPFTNWNILEVEGCQMTKDMCKKGGWEAFGFRNQGLCIQHVNTGKDSR